MRIRELLSSQSIALGAESANKKDIIEKMTVLMEASGNLTDRKQYLAGVLEREKEGTTGIGEGIAIPHAKNAAVKSAGLAAMVLKKPVDFDSLDGEPVKLIFMIAAPDNGANEHLEALSRLSAMLMDDTFREKLIRSENVDEFLKIIDEKERSQSEKEEKKAAVVDQETGYKVLAITACPTGIAHTFMAAESLEAKGKELGIPVKVETQGADGAKNVLTAQEIEEADGIIIAADKNVDLARFNGKKVLITKVADGIHKPEELIRKVENGDVPVYHHDGQMETETGEVKESFGRKIYKDLMNGVSHMLPFVIGGGILIAIAFLLDDYSIDPSNFGKNTPVAAYFKTIGEYAFGMMLPVLAGFIAMSIADRPGLAVGFVAGLVAKAGCTFVNPAGGDVNAGFLGALFAGFAAGYLAGVGLHIGVTGAVQCKMTHEPQRIGQRGVPVLCLSHHAPGALKEHPARLLVHGVAQGTHGVGLGCMIVEQQIRPVQAHVEQGPVFPDLILQGCGQLLQNIRAEAAVRIS